ncbi:hypothetical protein [Akkermansia muciniphila]|uniref:hypothetical protein n=1 Tax=Akkermansia muciniphila TaxID=239935 RepID=UPI001BFFBFBF|nr:hypothetical protein [Akkermansia muciniphila]MBT8792699.1 hypothetical protein [Akkermansia muciniphila]
MSWSRSASFRSLPATSVPVNQTYQDRPPANTENGLHHQHNGQQRNFLQNHFPLCAGRGYFPEMYAPLKPVSTLLPITPANGTRRKGRSLSITNSGKTTFTIGNKETLSIHSK